VGDSSAQLRSAADYFDKYSAIERSGNAEYIKDYKPKPISSE
jgi:hypothetical protein